MLGGTSMVTEVFLQCFNITMGVMLQSPVIFFLFLPSTYAFPSYCVQLTV